MSQYDQIRKKLIIDTPETVNTSWTSPAFSLDDRFGNIFISLKYNNGNSVDMKVYLQVCDSGKDEDFATIIESEQIIVDSDGSINYDLDGTGAPFARILIEVTAGAIDVYELRYTAGQFH